MKRGRTNDQKPKHAKREKQGRLSFEKRKKQANDCFEEKKNDSDDDLQIIGYKPPSKNSVTLSPFSLRPVPSKVHISKNKAATPIIIAEDVKCCDPTKKIISTINPKIIEISSNLQKFRTSLNPFREVIDCVVIDSTPSASSLEFTEFTHEDSNETNQPFVDNDVLTTDLSTDDVNVDDPAEEDYTQNPYYWTNFKYVLRIVIDDKFSSHLFDEVDIHTIETFLKLTDQQQKLYIRLYQRKYHWFNINDLKYPNIANDLSEIAEALIAAEFLEDEKSLSSLKDVLDLLPAPKVKEIATGFHIKTDSKGNKVTTKEKFVDAILHFTCKQKTVFQTKGTQNKMEQIVFSRAIKYVKNYVRVSTIPREMFLRVFALFSIGNVSYQDDKEGNQSQSQIYMLLLVNKGDVHYPSYSVNRQTVLFTEKSDLNEYCKMRMREATLADLVERKHYSKAYTIYHKFKLEFLSLLEDLKTGKSDKAQRLPYSLRCFTPSWIIVSSCQHSVAILEKLKKYNEAVELIRLLLSQTLYCLERRGMLWDRLCLDTHKHLKMPDCALDYIYDALNDCYVRAGRRYSLIERALRINKSKKQVNDVKCRRIFPLLNTTPKEVIISAEIFMDTTSAHRAIFKCPTTNNDNQSGTETVSSYSAVEAYVISYYKDNGYPFGIHGEGSTFLSLFVLVFWDVIFMPVADMFQNLYQVAPLDIYRDDFYSNRKEAIDQRLMEIGEMSNKVLADEVALSWNLHHGTHCFGISWDMFQSSDHVKGLAQCLGSRLLCGVFHIFTKDLRHRTGGLPDLVVWNVESLSTKIVEVKGPGDKLSQKQIIWLDILSYLDGDAIVCHVTGVGSKKHRISK